MYFPEDSQAHTFSLDADRRTIRWGSSKEWTLLYGSILQKIVFDIQPFSGKVYLSQGSLNYEHDQQYVTQTFYDSDKNDQKSVERLVSNGDKRKRSPTLWRLCQFLKQYS